MTAETLLPPETKEMLALIGEQLDAGQQLRAHNDGVIKPSTPAVARQPLGEEKADGRSWRTGRPAARSRQGAARREGASRRPRSSRAEARFGSDDLRTAYQGQVAHVTEAYSTLQAFPDDDGMWLLTDSSVISGLKRKATFLVALPYRAGTLAMAWGFWKEGGRFHWIGPRHTNFGNGSICAFSPEDRAWSEGGDVTTLLDLYSCWALRHLHLEVFGRWPGKQYSLGWDPAIQALYRLTDCKDHELCGCGSETRRYAECCKPSDLRWNYIDLTKYFLHKVPGGFQSRQPPKPVADFITGRATIPCIASVHPQFARR